MQAHFPEQRPVIEPRCSYKQVVVRRHSTVQVFIVCGNPGFEKCLFLSFSHFFQFGLWQYLNEAEYD